MRKRPRPTLSRVNLKATHGTKIVRELRFRWRRGREVEGTPLLREHTAYTRIEGSNPSVSASCKALQELQGFVRYAPLLRQPVAVRAVIGQYRHECGRPARRRL